VDRLFLDANVLFTAAHNPQGKADFLFDVLSLRRWRLVSSNYAVEEARRNINIKYPQCAPRLAELLQQLDIVPQPTVQQIPIELPDKDQPIYLAARSAHSTHLLTGDLRHFGPHMNQPEKSEGIVIQTVAEFLDDSG